MLTELQQRKFPNVFKMHDFNKDGFLTLSDFQDNAARVGRLRGWGPDSPELSEITMRFMAFWDGLSKMADVSQDGRVTREEYMAFIEKVVSTPGMLDAMIKPTPDFLYALMDRDGDRKISADEHAIFWQIISDDAELGREVFSRLDLNRDGSITPDEILVLVDEFYRSDDPDSPGNWFFGPF